MHIYTQGPPRRPRAQVHRPGRTPASSGAFVRLDKKTRSSYLAAEPIQWVPLLQFVRSIRAVFRLSQSAEPSSQPLSLVENSSCQTARQPFIFFYFDEGQRRALICERQCAAACQWSTSSMLAFLSQRHPRRPKLVLPTVACLPVRALEACAGGQRLGWHGGQPASRLRRLRG